MTRRLVGWLGFNVPFQHKYGYIRDENEETEYELWCCCVVLVHGKVIIIFVVSVCLSVCLFVCAEFFSAVFDPIWIKLRHVLHVRV